MSFCSSVPSKDKMDSKSAKKSDSVGNWYSKLKHPRLNIIKGQELSPGQDRSNSVVRQNAEFAYLNPGAASSASIASSISINDGDVLGRSNVALIFHSDAQIDIPSDKEENCDRKQWSSPVEFLLSCISMSV
ncbi:unnamed protein product, partial [Meganyctiphanes norvegica]